VIGGTLSLAQQAFLLRKAIPDARCTIRRARLTCEARLQPSLASCRYTVQVSYRHRCSPVTRVLDPALELRPDATRLPHVYDDGTLCLYLPTEWDSAMSIANTIMPWASEWLLHYEIWHASGHWTGGGHQPSAG
jgi:hypothetical protein